MEQFLLCIAVTLLFWKIGTGYVEQITTVYENNKWSNDIIACSDSNFVIEIVTVLEKCAPLQYRSVLPRQENAVAAICNTYNSCNISDTETTNALTMSCMEQVQEIAIQFGCIPASSLNRICSPINVTTSRIYLYSPVDDESPTGNTLRCECNIPTAKEMAIYIVKLEIDGNRGDGDLLLINRTLNITAYQKNGMTATWLSQFQTTKGITAIQNFTGSVSVLFLKERTTLDSDFQLLLKADGNFYLKCSNISDEKDIFTSKTTATTITLKDTGTTLLGGILAAVVAAIVLVFGIVFCWCKRKKKAREGEHQYESTEKATKNTHTYELQNGDASTVTRNGQYPMSQLNDEEDNLVINTDHSKAELTETCDVSGDLYGSNASGMDNIISYNPSQEGLASGNFTNSQTSIQKQKSGYDEALPVSYNKTLYHSSKDPDQKHVAASELTNSKNNMQNQNSGYDEAIPVSHNKELCKPSVHPEQGNPNDPPYFLYDDSHKRQVEEHTGTGSSASGTNVLHPVILDYAPSYMKTKGDAINTLKPLGNQGSPSNLGGSAQNLQAYSYADPRGRFVEGITPHIRGEGYDVEKSVEPPNTEDYKYEQFQSPAGKETPNHTGSRGNLGPYSYADCGGVKPKPGSTKEVKPVVEASNQHYESLNAIYNPNDTEDKGAGKEDAMPEHSAEYEGIAFVQKETKKPVVVNGVELIENEVYNQV